MPSLSYVSQPVALLKQILHKPRLRKLVYSILTRRFGFPIIRRADLVANPERYSIELFGSQTTVTPHVIAASDPLPASVMSHSQGFSLERPFVAEIRDVQLVGPSAIALTRDKSILMETVLPDDDYSRPAFEALPLRTLVHRQWPGFQVAHADTVCSLVNSWGKKVYAHWLMDCLPRLQGMEHYAAVTGRKPTLLIHANPRKWQVDSLKLLGYTPDDYRQWDGKRLHVDRLVVPSFRRQSRWTEKDAIHWMRDRMIQNLPEVQDKSLVFSPKIYISRGDAVGRRILNEDQVMKALEARGFVCYATEKLNFYDEVRLFSQAETIVGAHGSGLMNLIFATQKPLIVDLYGSWYTTSVYKMAASLEFPYACLQCEGTNANLRANQDDMIVDIDRLQRLLDRGAE